MPPKPIDQDKLAKELETASDTWMEISHADMLKGHVEAGMIARGKCLAFMEVALLLRGDFDPPTQDPPPDQF